jgi:hypothetical protein
MIRRYDMRRSDNYPYNSRIAYACSGSGTLNVITGFPVKSALVTFTTIPFAQDEEMSSSSEKSSSSSSSSSSVDSYSSYSSHSLSSVSYSESSSSESVSDSSSSSQTEIISGLPRIYVSSYLSNGFVVAYENIPASVGYIEFSYTAV